MISCVFRIILFLSNFVKIYNIIYYSKFKFQKLLLKYVDLIKINSIKTDLITVMDLAAEELIMFLTFICHFKPSKEITFPSRPLSGTLLPFFRLFRNNFLSHFLSFIDFYYFLERSRRNILRRIFRFFAMVSVSG